MMSGEAIDWVEIVTGSINSERARRQTVRDTEAVVGYAG